MASLCTFSAYVGSVFLVWITLITVGLSNLPVGCSAVRLYAAGNASFVAGQRESFWLSEAGNYSFGFSPTNDGQDHTAYLLSVWHSADPNRTALWWAGLDDDPSVASGSTFNFTAKGSLELHSPQGALLWSSSTGSSASYAQLQDTGNLVLLHANSTLWQSFDYPRDSLMLSDLQDDIVANKSFLLQSRSNRSSFAPGGFHIATDAYLNLYFHAIDSLGNDFIYVYASMNTTSGLRITRDNLILYRSATSSNKIQRMTLDYDGNLRAYMWESNVSSWKEVWQMLDDKCLLGSPCGPFGICNEVGSSVNCSCPPNYQPRVIGDISQGCKSLINFNASCGTQQYATNYNTTMVEVARSDYGYNDITRQSNVGLNDCKIFCLNECRCMAASYRADGVCFLKGNSQVGYLLNGHASNSNTLLIKVVETIIPVTNSKQGKPWVKGVGVGVPVAAVLMVALGCIVWLRLRGTGTCWTQRRSHKFEGDGRVRYFGYQELVLATRNFSEKLGEGGFGIVYKGWVKVGGQSGIRHNERLLFSTSNGSNEELAVAVKLLKGGADEERGAGGGGSAETQFRAEVRTLGKIHHVNLVSLLGYCSRKRRAGEQRLLVYEYMDNGSLDKFLSSSQHELLPWFRRYSIALGAARGIAYLHHECSPPILHCDIKPHNILLDNQFTAKVADFGFAKRFHMDSHISMSGIRGTRGYLAPEWLTSQELTSKVDVFSFGMLLLELVRGFKSLDDTKTPLMEWAVRCILEGVVEVHNPESENDGPKNVSTALDLASCTADQKISIQGSSDGTQKLQVLKVGMWCVQSNPSMRPPMSRVVQLIDGTLPVEDPPIPHTSSDFILPSSLISDSDYTYSTSTTSKSRHYSYSVVSGR